MQSLTTMEPLSIAFMIAAYAVAFLFGRHLQRGVTSWIASRRDRR
jgi:hypothetical protein